MGHHQIGQVDPWFTVAVIFLAGSALLIYPILALWTNHRYKTWPLRRYLFWAFGILAAGGSIAGPLGELARTSFSAHMAGHLLLGMLAPLLLLNALPMTLLMRALPRGGARAASGFFHSGYGVAISHPVIAAALNIGGLFIMYRTDVFMWMHQYTWVYAVVHLHVFLAGYLFTRAILYIDLTPKHYTFKFRAVVLILAFGAHKFLAKSLYAQPPPGIRQADAETGAMIMYYGGDAVDLAIIILFCRAWYKATAPGRAMRAA